MQKNKRSADLVSIMMPAKNGERYLAETLESVLNQDYSNWELVFVDDGSTDNTLAIAQAYAERDSRIRIFSQNSLGRGAARNKCIDHCVGEFVAVADSDDILTPDRLSKQVEFLRQNPDISAVASAWIPFYQDGATKRFGEVESFPSSPIEIERNFSRGKMRFHNATALIRGEMFDAVGSYNVELRRAQDYELFSRASRLGFRFAAVSVPLIYYRKESAIPARSYFLENGMYMAFADRLLSRKENNFAEFELSSIGRAWKAYYHCKYFYFWLKLKIKADYS